MYKTLKQNINFIVCIKEEQNARWDPIHVCLRIIFFYKIFFYFYFILIHGQSLEQANSNENQFQKIHLKIFLIALTLYAVVGFIYIFIKSLLFFIFLKEK